MYLYEVLIYLLFLLLFYQVTPLEMGHKLLFYDYIVHIFCPAVVFVDALTHIDNTVL